MILQKNLQIPLKCFSPKLILHKKPIKCVSKCTAASLRGFTNSLELFNGEFFFSNFPDLLNICDEIHFK